MKLIGDRWVKHYQNANKVLGPKGCGPSDGIVCILASLNYIREMRAEELAKPVEKDKKPPTLNESFLELFKDCWEGKPQGFASNASAAAKAAKLGTGLTLDVDDIKMD